MTKVIKYIFLTTMIAGCSTSSFNVSSSPDKADVFLSYKGQKVERIGVTPLRMNQADINLNNSAQITIKKEGFESQSFLLPKSIINQNIELNASLEEQKTPASCQQQTQSVEKVAKVVARSLYMLQTKNFEMAQSLVKNLILDYPNSATLWGILGNAYYMDKQTVKALEAYENSLKLNPESPETKRMVNKLKGLTSSLLQNKEVY